MAVDSIIARPTNKVRVMVAEASGCCASEAQRRRDRPPFAERRPHTAEAGGEAGGDD